MTKMLISLVTRGRPQILLETIAKTLANCRHPNTQILVGCDADDKETIEALGPVSDPRVIVSVKEREDTIAEKWNRALLYPADLYMPMVDHTVPVTEGFDVRMLEAAEFHEDGICAVHTMLANLSFAAYNALSAKWVETLGEIYPSFFPFWFVDHWTDDLARMIGRIVPAYVMCDASKKQMTQELREAGWWATWYDAAFPLRVEQAERLLARMDIPDKQKDKQRRQYGWVFHRSRWINDTVRAQDRQLSVISGLSNSDERYQRLRGRAVVAVDDLIKRWGTPPVDYRAILDPPKTIPNLLPSWRGAQMAAQGGA